MDLTQMRREYTHATLDETSVDPDPLKQFEKWFGEAVASEVPEPNAMLLATSGVDRVPSIRAVLLKLFDARGFVFFTNYNSDKARDIAENPNVALEFLWLDLERQIKIVGHAEKISAAESLKYFLSRSHSSRIGAWVSDQSSVITSRKALAMQFEKIKAKFADGEVPLPDFWGGYRVVPEKIEFWQGRESRLHDRILYTRSDGGWTISRLAP
ncbi:MAG: pyridoxamine 5'-phosphate oxidase [Campylobacterales bacterium]|nr:pyridoxamine 5'-phosphate oxidase [Campylobacterales bacterium]